jgi:hypothetical protein
MKAVMNKIIILKIICLVFSAQISFSQENNIYFDFDEKKGDYFLKEDGSGKKIKEPLFIKNMKANGDIVFYIKDLMFVYDKSIMLKRKVSLEKFKESLLSVDETIEYIETIRKEYPFGYKYPSKKHPKMYILERSCENNVILYEVNWQYYIE